MDLLEIQDKTVSLQKSISPNTNRPMRHYLLPLIAFIIISCNAENEQVKLEEFKWSERRTEISTPDSLMNIGSTYLSIYSQIYSSNDGKVRNLTVTVSMRNVSETDTLYISRAESFNTIGHSIREYAEGTVYVLPMETIEIIIKEKDSQEGTGGNFMFDWQIKKGAPDPIFESVMISTTGQQGISFVTSGKRIK